MDELIQQLSGADKTVQALAVSVGGLIGVFLTLGVFFVVIWVSDRVARKRGK